MTHSPQRNELPPSPSPAAAVSRRSSRSAASPAIRLGRILFRIRGYTPLPVVFLFALEANPSAATLTTGLAVALTGELLRFWGVAYAGGETRTRRMGASRLVTGGPYAYTRNPLYLANLLIYIGFTISANMWVPYLLMAVFIYFAVQYHLIILSEEQELQASFREIFDAYRQQVPRYLPKIKRAARPVDGLAPNFRTALRSERSTFISLTVVIAILLLRMMVVG